MRKNKPKAQRKKAISQAKTHQQRVLDNIEIEDLSHDGRGIGRINGKTIFVSSALPGEIVTVNVTQSKKRFDMGEAIEIQQPSTDRVIPRCEYFAQCGGCDLQHLTHSQQLVYKEKRLLDNLRRISSVEPENLLPPIHGPLWQYRRKARLAIHYNPKNKHLLFGFRAKNSKLIINIDHCEVLDEPFTQQLKNIALLLKELDSIKHITHCELSVADNGSAIVLRHTHKLSEGDLNVLRQYGVENNVQIYLQTEKHNSPLPLDPNYPELRYEFNGIDYTFSPTDFIQVNGIVNSMLIQQALELLSIEPQDRILDLYSGIGNLSLPVAKRAQKVYGVEGSDPMVARAKTNAQYNHLENCEFFQADLTDAASLKNWIKQFKINKIILDPPRDGAIHIAEELAKSTIEKILYISCDPGTLARDTAALLKHKKYRLTHSGIMDMFPHTSHVESMLLFTRK